MKVLSFGEVLWDVYENSKYIGGAPLNFAAHFKKCGGEARIITAVGCDSLGQETISAIKALGIGTDYITISEKHTGRCLVKLDENQVPSYNLLDDVAYDFIQKPDFNAEKFDVLYFGTLAMRNEHNRDTLKQIIDENVSAEVFVDMNIRPPFYGVDVVKFACKNATILKISDEELPVVLKFLNFKEESLEKTISKIAETFDNLKLIIITRGGEDSTVFDCVSKKVHNRSAEKVQVVSTVGAGDSFSASFLAKYMETKDIPKALDFSAKISGYVVSKKEAIPDYDISDFT